MKASRLLKLLLSLCIVLPLTAIAHDFTYTYEGQTLRYTVSGTTCAVGSRNSVSGAITIPEVAVDETGQSYPVTEIGSSAFSGCSELTSVNLCNTVISINNNSFYECAKLNTIIIPKSVTVIGAQAFRGCSSLTSILIGSSVTSIGDDAFRGCTAIKELKLDDGNETLFIGKNNGLGMFRGSQIETLYIGRNLSYNGSSYAPFKYLTTLKSVTIGSSVTSIDNSAFFGCSNVTELTFEDGDDPLTLGNNGISNGSYLGLFSSCAIEKLYLGRNLSYQYAPFENMETINTVIIGTSVTAISKSAFSGCTGITSVTIPNSVTSIGEAAFKNCSGLSSLTIPNFVTSISKSTFTGCTSLNSITVPNSVTSIGESAFLG